MIHVKKDTTYFINERALLFSENDLDDPQRVSVSLVSGTVIMVHVPGVIDYASDGNYERWTLKGYSTKLVSNEPHFVYARLSRNDRTALIVFSVKDYNVEGGVTTVVGKDENGNDITETSEPSADYFYIRIGTLTGTDGKTERDLTYDSGLLGTKKGDEESTGINEMWELSKLSTPWLIRAKQWLAGFTVKGFITLVGGLVFRKGETEKPVTDIKRSFDSEEDVPVSDDTIPTTSYTHEYVENEIEKLDERFLSKVKDDNTPFSLGVGGNLEVGKRASVKGSIDVGGNTSVEWNVTVGGDVKSKDFTEGVTDAGYGMFKNSENHYQSEADIVVARILSEVYDLLVERNAVFKGPLSSSEFISGFVGGKGWAIRLQEYINAAGETEQRSIAEFDDLIVRGTMRVFEFVVNQLLGENDNRIFTGMMEVDHYDAGKGILYLSTNGGKLYNPFRADDIIIVQQYGGMPSEDNDYYVTKQYEFLVTEVGIGDMSAGEDRLDWLKFTNFSSPMEGADMTLITKGDTLVRIDNLYDMRRKGIVQIMSVGEDTPYMDMVYGAKTDPENCVKGRLGNLGGIYNSLFGWLREFGAYLINLYAVGEFRIAHTGEDVADAIDIAKGSFRTNYRQTTYDMTEDDNFLTNAAMTNDCEGWILMEDSVEYFLVDGLPQYFNYELYASESSYAGLASYNDRDMIRLLNASIRQSNDLIRKPGTHKEYSGEDAVVEVVDKLYLNIRLYCHADGEFTVGFADSDGTFHNNDFYSTGTYEAGVDAYTISLSGTWDSVGDFCMKSTGDIYIDSISLTDKPLENYRIETSTRIEQDATKIALIAQRTTSAEKNISDLTVDVNGIKAEVEKVKYDEDGNITNISKSGLVLDDEYASLFSEQADAQGMVKRAELGTYVQYDPVTGELKSNVKISADHISISANEYIGIINKGTTKIDFNIIDFSANELVALINDATITIDQARIDVKSDDLISIINKGTTVISSSRLDLSGLVTYSELNTTLGGYATDSELSSAKNELNTSISNLNSTLSTKIDAKAETSSVTSLTNKVNDLNSIVSGKADASALKNVAYLDDAAAAALSGSTIVKNGYLATDYIKVDTIWAVKGTVGGFTIESDKLTVTTELEDDGVFVNPIYTTELSGQGIYVKVGNNAAIESRIGLSWFTDLDTQYFTSVNVSNNQVDAGRNIDNACVVRASLNPKDYGLFIEGGSTHILSSGVTKLHGLVLNQRWVSTTSTLLANDDIIMFNNTSAITVSLDNNVPVGKVYYLKRTTNYNVGLKGQLRGSPYIDIQNTTVALEWASYMVIHTDTAWTIYYCG